MSINLVSVLLSPESILEKSSELALQIQQCRDLKSLLQGAIADIRSLLQTDRVLIYRCLEDHDGVVAFESVGAEWTSLLGKSIYASCFDVTWVKQQQGQTPSISEFHRGRVTALQAELLERLQIEASLVVPLFSQGLVWGVLVAHHCRSPRKWQPLEKQLLQHMTLQLGIAIQQAELRAYQQQLEGELQSHPVDLSELKRAQINLQKSGQTNRALIAAIPDLLIRTQSDGTYLEIAGRDRLSIHADQNFLAGSNVYDSLPHAIAQQRMEQIQQALQSGAMQINEQQLLINGQLHDEEVRVVVTGDDEVLIMVRDITARKRTEVALRASEERHRSIITAVAEGIVIQQVDGTITTFNASAERLLGLTPDQLLGKTSVDLGWHPIQEDGSPFSGDAHPTMIALKTGEPQSKVVMGICKGEDTTWISIHSQPLYHAEATKPYAVVTSFADITELKQAERALKWQAKQRCLLTTITQKIRQSLDLDHILNTTVTEVRQLLQTDRVIIYQFAPDWSGRIIAESVAEGWRSVLGMQITDTYFVGNQGQPYVEGRVAATDDIYTANLTPCHVAMLEQLQVRAKLVMPILQDNHLWGLLVAQHCRSPRQWEALEIELQQHLATQIAIAIQQAELHRQVKALNTGLELQVQERTAQLQQALEFEALLKRITDRVRDSLDEEEILQKAVQELAQALKADCCDTTIYNVDRTIAVVKYEYNQDGFTAEQSVCVLADNSDPNLFAQLFQGHYANFCLLGQNAIRPRQPQKAILACPMMDDQGVLGDLWVFKPSHEIFNDQEVRLVQQVANQCAIALRQSRLYQAAQAQVQALERLNELKDDFLSTVSHELRTPMSTIKMATQMLEISLQPLGVLDDATNAISRYVKILREEGQREIALINDLLDLTRLDAGAEPLRLTTIALQCYIPHLTESFSERIRQQQQQLAVHIPDHLPDFTTNLPYLERILTELLNNACKYTPSGETITISAQATSEALEIRVSNTGTEIPMTEYDRIFDKFYRIPNNDPWKHGGTGLGLALVRKLTERLGGQIHITSGNGQTTFVLTFEYGVGTPSCNLVS